MNWLNDIIDTYNVIWDTPSKDASESMPCGGGDIGLNVWVEDGDVLFYISRSGSLAEQNEYLKLGRVRLRLTPNPFADPTVGFRQELMLRKGHVEIAGTLPGVASQVLVRIWVEIDRPVIRIEVESESDVQVLARYENWRLEEEILGNESTRRHSCFTLNAYPGEVTLSPDEVDVHHGGILFYHCNPRGLLRDLLIEQQGLEEYANEIPDDLADRTFGGLMLGDGFEPVGVTDGSYQTKPFKAWSLQSIEPTRAHDLRIVTYIDQSETLVEWLTDLRTMAQASADDIDEARQSTLEWWAEFWGRSHIAVNPASPNAADRAWRIARNYNLFRYQLGCNAFGEYPTKFNGGNFTFDANLVGDNWSEFGPDWRQWGGGVFTAQNQRLVYWPMLKSGDDDAILSQFELYRKALPGAQARVKANFDHDGAVYSEYIGVPGLAVGMGYGWESGNRKRGEEMQFGDPRADSNHQYNEPVEMGVMACKPISYHWESQLEHAYMILEYRRFTGADISDYVPFIENAVVFFDEHYRKRENMRSGKELDENGHLVIYPSKACETFRGATNPADLVSGLNACIDLILTLDDDLLSLRDKDYYDVLKTRIPPLTYDEKQGRRVILPAKSWKEYGNAELPMLYPLFPFNRFDILKDDMQVFRDTYELGEFRKGNVVSWHQDGIFFARMGQAEEAADFNARKLDDSERRFPTFWGPGHDWVPDHNWGGSGMIGLQEMLLQTIGDAIHILPAWPTDWDVDFKLHAPKQTTVEVSYKNGEIVSLTVTPESRRADVILSTRPTGDA